MVNKLRVLDLFSGIGGFSLGLERTGGFETVAFCEIEEFSRRVLAKHWPETPCFEDVRKLTKDDIDGPVDVICGGYPCQPFSTAGKRRGKEDDRHLWPEFSRLVAELRPSWVIGENVAGHISMGLDDVLSDLERQGYACRTFVIPACAVGAPHRRDRCWTIANSGDVLQPRELDARANCETPSGSESGNQCEGWAKNGQRVWVESSTGCKDVANPNGKGLQRRAEAGNSCGSRKGRDEQSKRCAYLPGAAWLPEPKLGRVGHGFPGRMDRLKALGNAIVPQIATLIGEGILNAR